MPSRSRILLWCSASGALWALAWPAIGGLTPLAFVAWLPLLHAERLHETRTQDRRRAFFPYVLLTTFIWNASCSWWFYCVSEPWSTKLVSVGAPVLVNTVLMALPWWLKRVVRRTHGTRASSLAFVVLWLAFERLHHGWDLQWPWFSLGNVFGTRPAWVQWYEITGVLGGSLWVLIVNLLLDQALNTWRSDRVRSIRRLVFAGLIIALPLAASFWRFSQYAIGTGRPVEVVIVQPNVDPYNAKFDRTTASAQLDAMLRMGEPLITGSTALVLFPETALQENATVDLSGDDLVLNGLWENDLSRARSVQRLRAFQELHPQVALLCGMSSDRLLQPGELPLTARPLGDGRHWYESYNAALWLPASGGEEVYHKSKLVAGVELMPFEEVLGPLGALAVDLGGTTGSLGQQEERAVLRDARSGLAIAPAICYESVFGEHVGAHIRNGANLIAIMTNDGWWDDTPGYHQHLTFASLRAIETRRDVVRSANTGISCLVDQRGIIHERTSWWQPAVIRVHASLNDDLSFFVRHGDLIGLAVLPAAALVLLMIVVRLSRSVQRSTTRRAIGPSGPSKRTT